MKLGSLGGKALVKKRGKKYFKELSKKGIQALRNKYEENQVKNR